MQARERSSIRTYGTPNVAGREPPIVRWVAAHDGVKIRVLEWEGSHGAPLQLLHGSTGNASMWQLLADAFPRRRVVASDHRGYGETDGPLGTCTTDWHVRDAEAVRNGLGLGKPVLVGYSGGAVDSVHYASTHPDAFSAVVLIDPPMFAPPPKEVMDFFSTMPREFADLDSYVKLQRAGPLFRGASLHSLRLYGTYTLRPGPDGVWRPMSQPQALREWNPSLAALDVWGLASRIRVPTLLIRAAGAPILPQEVALKLVSTLHDGRLAVVEKASHGLPMEDPDAMHTAIRDFLSETGL